MCFTTDNASTKVNSLLTAIGAASKREMRKRSRVTFENKVSCMNSSVATVSTDEIEGLWYKKSDMKMFQLQARDQVLKSFQNDNEEEFRGLERYTLERTEAKQLHIRASVLAFRLGLGEEAESLSMVAKKIASASQEQAFIQGCHDYCDAYYPDLKFLVPSSANESQAAPTPKKRTACNPQQEGRRVRMRMTV